MSINYLYYQLPPFLKNYAVSLIGILKGRKKYGKYYQERYSQLLNNDFNTTVEEDVNTYLNYITKNFNFYKKFRGKSLEEFPIINKEIVRNQLSDFYNGGAYIKKVSSGSTGSPFVTYISKKAYQYEYAFWWYHRYINGVNYGDKIATIAGHKVVDIKQKKPPFWVYNFFENQILFSSYHLHEYNLKYYIQELNKFRPVLINGYPSSLYILSQYIIDNNIELSFKPKFILTSSETLLTFQRKIIEKAFASKVRQLYGNTELNGLIYECPFGKLHVQQRHSYIRILKEDNSPAEEGEKGRIVSTNYNNEVFPLINYETNDYVLIATNQKCPCGDSGLIIESIDGRIEDYILLPDGRRVGRLDHIFKIDIPVIKSQIIQEDLSEIKIVIVKKETYKAKHEKIILNEARHRLGSQIKIQFVYVNDIPNEKNGKFRFIKQNIK